MKKFFHGVAFLFLLGNNVAHLLNDWLFYTEAKDMEKGIVYGEPDQDAVRALLAFSIIGTLTFTCEIANLCLECFSETKQYCFVDSDSLSALVIWLVDIPQMGISLSLILCREEPVSVFQLGKACVIVIGIFVRTLVSVATFYNDKHNKEHHIKFKALFTLGMITEFALAVTIFDLSQTERNDSGTVSFRVPTTLFDDQFSDQRYFANVSIFASHAHFLNQDQLDPDKNDSVVNWIRLTTINKLRSSPNKELEFNIQFEQVANVLKMAIWEKRSSWTLVVCYIANVSIPSVQNITNTACTNTAYFNDPVNAFIKFRFEEPSSVFKKNVLGEIYVNMKLNQSGQCTPYSDYRSTIEESLRDQVNMTLHYYRTNLPLFPTDTSHMKHNGTEDVAFFRNTESDMTDVLKIWKTGWKDCKATGHIAPVLDPAMKLNCSMT